MARISFQRGYDAPVTTVWDVVSDHELYGTAAPNLSTVEVLDGAGEGMVRRCVDTDGNEWTETCTRWEDEREFAVAVDVEHSDFHRRLFTRFAGRWRISPRGDGAQVTIEFEFDPKFGPLGVLITNVFEYKAPAVVESIFDSWAREIQSRHERSAEAVEQRDSDDLGPVAEGPS